MFYRAGKITGRAPDENHRNNGLSLFPAPDIFKASSKRVTSVRHTHCGYRVGFLRFTLSGRKATGGTSFSDDNPLIRSVLHSFPLLSLCSLFLSLFFELHRPRDTVACSREYSFGRLARKISFFLYFFFFFWRRKFHYRYTNRLEISLLRYTNRLRVFVRIFETKLI